MKTADEIRNQFRKETGIIPISTHGTTVYSNWLEGKLVASQQQPIDEGEINQTIDILYPIRYPEVQPNGSGGHIEVENYHIIANRDAARRGIKAILSRLPSKPEESAKERYEKALSGLQLEKGHVLQSWEHIMKAIRIASGYEPNQSKEGGEG